MAFWYGTKSVAEIENLRCHHEKCAVGCCFSGRGPSVSAKVWWSILPTAPPSLPNGPHNGPLLFLFLFSFSFSFALVVVFLGKEGIIPISSYAATMGTPRNQNLAILNPYLIFMLTLASPSATTMASIGNRLYKLAASATVQKHARWKNATASNKRKRLKRNEAFA